MHVYTDESRLTGDRFMLIGGLWVRAADEPELRAACADLRTKIAAKHPFEFKFVKVRRYTLANCLNFADIFFRFPALKFNCIVLDKHKIDYDTFHEGDDELGFYKFYFQLLSRRVVRGCDYLIFPDHRSNRKPNRLVDLKQCINNWCRLGKTPGFSPVRDVSPVDSKKDDVMQLADLILGAVGYRCNGRAESPPKVELVEHIEKKLGRRLDKPCMPSAPKLNVWRWTPTKKAP